MFTVVFQIEGDLGGERACLTIVSPHLLRATRRRTVAFTSRSARSTRRQIDPLATLSHLFKTASAVSVQTVSMKTKLKYVILFVEDVAASRKFFSDAFGIPPGFVHESGDYGEMQSGETTLSFSSRRLMQQLGKNPGRPDVSAPVFEIAFEVDDVTGALARARGAGATVVQEVRAEEWGQTTAYVRDPDGYLVEICSPVSAS